ncbi:hypothetical protein EV401DRAFT_488359 [Pisolithus croceorrhizus]|nr:hypothetical protein EV401DRAFT_488359 [Pisolithus croceorrhizus]
MSILNADVLHIVSNELLYIEGRGTGSSLLNLSIVSRLCRQACLPIIFSEVRWPHKSKTDPDNGLSFLPESLRPHVRHLQLIWHDEWTEPGRLRHGYFDRDGMYIPFGLGVVSSAIVCMPKLNAITMSCPFLPPQSLFEAIGKCASLTSFSLMDTPIDMGLISVYSASLSRVNLAPVGQSLRIGDGPTYPKVADISYFMRDWRRKYRLQAQFRGLREPRACTVFLRQQAPCLTHLDVSGDLCSFAALAAVQWPELRTLVLYGHVPGTQISYAFPVTPPPEASIWDALERMPMLSDLRLLFSRSRGKDFVFLPEDRFPDPTHLKKLASLTNFAISNACKLDGILNYFPSLQKLAILAMVDLPRWPIALYHAEAERVVTDVARSGCPLKHLRIIIEDKLTPPLCHLIATLFPLLEVLEIERCGYHDGKSMSTCQEFVDALLPLSALQSLRLCMQFPEYDEVDEMESWKAVRAQSADLFASALKNIRQVGFEYRKRTGTHRYQDAWLDFTITRYEGKKENGWGTTLRGGCRDQRCVLRQLPELWYAFPEVWTPTRLPF